MFPFSENATKINCLLNEESRVIHIKTIKYIYN
jgi:hypothetical protein